MAARWMPLTAMLLLGCARDEPKPGAAQLTPVVGVKVATPNLMVPPGPRPSMAAPARPASDGALPIEGILVPPLPQRATPVLVAQGVVRESVRFEVNDTHIPGGRAAMWLYLPTPDRIRGPLPAVVIGAEGGDGRTGATLDRGQLVHHLPWLEAGFAVLAYEIDGALPSGAVDDELVRDAAERAFEASLGGLVNARNARAFLRARVPEVASGAVFAAGIHESATVAMLLAAHDPELAGVAAIAPRQPPTLGLAHMDPTVRHALEDEADAVGVTLGERERLIAAIAPTIQGRRIQAPVFIGIPADASPGATSELRQLVGAMSTGGVTVTTRTVPDAGLGGIGDALAWVQTQLSARRPTR